MGIKIKNSVFAVSIGLSSLGVACTGTELPNQKKILVISEPIYNNLAGTGSFNIPSVEGTNNVVTEDLYLNLLREGRILNVEVLNSSNCVGNLTD